MSNPSVEAVESVASGAKNAIYSHVPTPFALAIKEAFGKPLLFPITAEVDRERSSREQCRLEQERSSDLSRLERAEMTPSLLRAYLNHMGAARGASGILPELHITNDEQQH